MKRMAAGLFFAYSTVSTALFGCATDGKEVNGDKQVKLEDDGLPNWIDDCGVGLEKGTICAVAESDFAATDVEAAKTDAEIAAKNRISDQLSTKVGRLQERVQNVVKDLSRGKAMGERSLKDINQNFVERELVGLRYESYFFYPNRVNPTKVWVRATLTVDDAAYSQQIVDSMMQSAMAEGIELKHEEAQARFDAVRKAYLQEEATKRGE
jgi:hypothetical protein